MSELTKQELLNDALTNAATSEAKPDEMASSWVNEIGKFSIKNHCLKHN
jgi:hypothetical protein